MSWVGFRQSGFSADFCFWAAGYFSADLHLLAGFCLIFFVGKKCPRKSSGKIPGKKCTQIYTTEILQTPISAERQGPTMCGKFWAHEKKLQVKLDFLTLVLLQECSSTTPDPDAFAEMPIFRMKGMRRFRPFQ